MVHRRSRSYQRRFHWWSHHRSPKAGLPVVRRVQVREPPETSRVDLQNKSFTPLEPYDAWDWSTVPYTGRRAGHDWASSVREQGSMVGASSRRLGPSALRREPLRSRDIPARWRGQVRSPPTLDGTPRTEAYPPPMPRIPFPEEPYVALLGQVAYAVSYVEWLLLGDLGRLPDLPEQLSVDKTRRPHDRPDRQGGRRSSSEVSHPDVRRFLEVCAQALHTLAPLRNHILHARPADHRGCAASQPMASPARRLSRGIPDRRGNPVVDPRSSRPGAFRHLPSPTSVLETIGAPGMRRGVSLWIPNQPSRLVPKPSPISPRTSRIIFLWMPRSN